MNSQDMYLWASHSLLVKKVLFFVLFLFTEKHNSKQLNLHLIVFTHFSRVTFQMCVLRCEYQDLQMQIGCLKKLNT